MKKELKWYKIAVSRNSIDPITLEMKYKNVLFVVDYVETIKKSNKKEAFVIVIRCTNEVIEDLIELYDLVNLKGTNMYEQKSLSED